MRRRVELNMDAVPLIAKELYTVTVAPDSRLTSPVKLTPFINTTSEQCHEKKSVWWARVRGCAVARAH